MKKAKEDKKQSKKEKCLHENYDIKQVMDFKFCVCTACGYQWKYQ